ncbi:hypothetical protein [Roseivirga spongicola]|uniref:hypothetical protein n=1 Tax=Roseivirga spongicola TaxID=333140 RepID=UPI002AC8AD6F|nr:hypothetical protein [Roseivirga spongicola]WPZ08706.1 hypothetical protein T7867_10600 [Roseivirga spongicola]
MTKIKARLDILTLCLLLTTLLINTSLTAQTKPLIGTIYESQTFVHIDVVYKKKKNIYKQKKSVANLYSEFLIESDGMTHSTVAGTKKIYLSFVEYNEKDKLFVYKSNDNIVVIINDADGNIAILWDYDKRYEGYRQQNVYIISKKRI